jgi:hypothetical protein
VRKAVASLCLLLLAPIHSAAASGGLTLTAHVGTVQRQAPMRLYTSLDKPTLFGAEVTTPLTNRVGVGLDVAFGSSRGERDRKSLTVVSGGALFQSRQDSRVSGLAGLGLAVRIDDAPFPSLTARGRFGADIHMASRMFVRSEFVLDVGGYLDTMATARVGVGFRF